MPLSIDNLTPYLSVIILKIEDGSFNMNSLKNELCETSGSFQEQDLASTGAKVYFYHYNESKPVSWANDPNIKDSINHILIVCKIDNYLAIYHSDNNKKNKLFRLIFRDTLASEFKKLRLIKKEVLHAVFLQGKIKNLWLNNIDKSTEIKADSKVLSGADLIKTLDPIGDQTYSFSALKVQNSDMVIGVNSSDSKIWIKKFSSSREYFDEVCSILTRVREMDQLPNLSINEIPILSSSHIDIEQLGGLIDVQLENIENFHSSSDEYILLNEIYWEWGDFSFRFYLISPLYYGFELTDDTGVVKYFRISFTLEYNQLKYNVIGSNEDEKIIQVLEHKDLVKYYFDNSQVISNGFIYKQNYKDIFFKGFVWANFDTYDIKKEKPDPQTNPNFDLIGSDNSLFSWVKKFWKGYSDDLIDMDQTYVNGWLVCDDGAGEKADFIHVSDEETPTITLIHIKGANSKSGRIAVTPYEIVVSQAVKNIRYLDINILRSTIEEVSERVEELVWYNGEHIEYETTRENFKLYLDEIENYNKRIVVIQPHIKNENYNDPHISESAKIQKNLLNALLVSAQSTVQGLGAEFVVIGAE